MQRHRFKWNKNSCWTTDLKISHCVRFCRLTGSRHPDVELYPKRTGSFSAVEHNPSLTISQIRKLCCFFYPTCYDWDILYTQCTMILLMTQHMLTWLNTWLPKIDWCPLYCACIIVQRVHNPSNNRPSHLIPCNFMNNCLQQYISTVSLRKKYNILFSPGFPELDSPVNCPFRNTAEYLVVNTTVWEVSRMT